LHSSRMALSAIAPFGRCITIRGSVPAVPEVLFCSHPNEIIFCLRCMVRLSFWRDVKQLQRHFFLKKICRYHCG
jgi:hypothetical protein